MAEHGHHKLRGSTFWKAIFIAKVLFLALSVIFFVCVWNVSGTAEQICTKFTRNTCLVPLSNEFEGQCQRSRSPGTKRHFSALLAACVWFVSGKTSLLSSSYLSVHCCTHRTTTTTTILQPFSGTTQVSRCTHRRALLITRKWKKVGAKAPVLQLYCTWLHIYKSALKTLLQQNPTVLECDC